MAATTRLKCSVSAGQFSDEVAIRAPDYQGHEFSLFVSRPLVVFDPSELAQGRCEGLVKVSVLGEHDHLALIKLPGMTFANGSMVTVHSNQLQAEQSSPA